MQIGKCVQLHMPVSPKYDLVDLISANVYGNKHSTPSYYVHTYMHIYQRDPNYLVPSSRGQTNASIRAYFVGFATSRGRGRQRERERHGLIAMFSLLNN